MVQYVLWSYAIENIDLKFKKKWLKFVKKVKSVLKYGIVTGISEVCAEFASTADAVSVYSALVISKHL